MLVEIHSDNLKEVNFRFKGITHKLLTGIKVELDETKEFVNHLINHFRSCITVHENKAKEQVLEVIEVKENIEQVQEIVKEQVAEVKQVIKEIKQLPKQAKSVKANKKSKK